VIESPEKISTMSGGDKALYWTIGAVDEITLGWSSTKRRAIVRSADNWANFTKTFKPFGGVYDSAIPSGRSIEIYTTDGVHPKEVEGGYRCDGRNAYNGQIIDCLIYNLKDDGIYIVDMRQKFGFINYLSMVDSMPDFESAFEKNDCGAGLAGEVNSNAKNFFCQQALNGIYDLDAGDFTSDGILKVKEFIEGLEQYRNIVGSKQAGTVQSVFPAETMTIANYLIYNKNNTAALANYKYFLATAIYGLPTQVLVIKGDPTGLYGPVAADIIGGDTAVVVQGDVLTIKVNTPGKASMINAFREYAGDQALNLAKLGSLMSFHDATGNQLSAEVVAVGNNIKVYLEKGMFNEGEAYYVLIDLPSGNKKIAQIKLNLDNVQMVGPIAVVSQEEPCVAVIPETSAVMAEGGVEYPEGTDYYYTTFIEYDTVSAQAYNPDGDILHTETFNIETEEDVDFSAVPINELDDVSQAAYYAAEEEAVVNIQLWLSEEVGPPIGTVSGAVEVVESATNMCPVITNDVPQVLVNLGSLGGTNGINTNVVFEVALSGVGINGSTNTNDFVIAKGTNDVDNINTNEMKFYAIGAPTNVLDVGVNTNNQVIVSNGVTNAFVDFTPLSSNGVEAVVLNDVAITSTNDTVNLGGTNAVVLVPGTNVIVNIPQTNDLGVVSNAVCDIALLTNGVSSNLVVDCGADGSNMVDLASIGSNGVSGVESNLLVPVGRNWEQVLGVGTNGTNFIEALVVPVIDPTKGTNDLGVVIKTNSGVEAEVTFPVIGGN